MFKAHRPARLAACFIAITLTSLPRAAAQDDEARLKSQPIATASGKAAELLRQWWQEGTAAGNVGDWYDNRDGDHSPLNLAAYPQLQRIRYSDDQVKQKKHWAAQQVLLSKVVFGNSSTSAPPTLGGSNPRRYYTLPVGIAFLHEQYRMNNLYIYPEHRDHDPGHNGLAPSSPSGKGGEGGYGDLYPTNTPYLIISQGSSGSDQPFMRALPLTLAAFRPEVKKKLTDEKLLMPTVQWLLRSTNKHLKEPREYLTGKAHPTVFEGGWVDELAMVQKAHALTLESLPPLVQLKVLEEDAPPKFGRDFFDPGMTEKLGDTRGVIARIFRGAAQKRRIVVSAADSFDVNQQALSFTWVVLRGDASKIRITPRGKESCEAEIVVGHHERRPIAPGSPLESNRVDIGVFAHNGTHNSPPAFITFFSLDNESRKYDDQGRIAEMAYARKNFVDFRLSHPKEWRDVYRYNAQGQLLGWTRHDGDKTTEFGRQGLLIVEKDKLGRCTKGRTVRYAQEPSKNQGPNTNPLRWLPGDALESWQYASDDDFMGRVVESVPAPSEKK